MVLGPVSTRSIGNRPVEFNANDFDSNKVIDKIEYMTRVIIGESLDIEKRPNNQNTRDGTQRLKCIPDVSLFDVHYELEESLDKLS